MKIRINNIESNEDLSYELENSYKKKDLETIKNIGRKNINSEKDNIISILIRYW